MVGTKRKSSDSESAIEEQNEELKKDSLETEEMGRGKRAKKVNRKLVVSEEDRQKEAARLEKKLAKLKSATVIQEPKQVSLKAASSVKQTGGIQASSNKKGKKAAAPKSPETPPPPLATIEAGKLHFSIVYSALLGFLIHLCIFFSKLVHESSDSDLSESSSHDESDFKSEDKRVEQQAKRAKQVSCKAPTTNSITPRVIEGIESF